MNRIASEKAVSMAMVRLFCAGHHGTAGHLCENCRLLSDYACGRLENCRFGDDKPTCRLCPTHCYAPSERQQIRRIMQWSGPRMIYRHPVMAAKHFWRERLARRG